MNSFTGGAECEFPGRAGGNQSKRGREPFFGLESMTKEIEDFFLESFLGAKVGWWKQSQPPTRKRSRFPGGDGRINLCIPNVNRFLHCSKKRIVNYSVLL